MQNQELMKRVQDLLPLDLSIMIMGYVYEETLSYIAIREQIAIYKKEMNNEIVETLDFIPLNWINGMKEGGEITFLDWYFNEIFLANIVKQGNRYYDNVYLRELNAQDVEEWPYTIDFSEIIDIY